MTEAKEIIPGVRFDTYPDLTFTVECKDGIGVATLEPTHKWISVFYPLLSELTEEQKLRIRAYMGLDASEEISYGDVMYTYGTFKNPKVDYSPIKVKKIEPQTVECFDPDGNSLGFLNEYEFNFLRIQIMLQKADGYYAVHKGTKIIINHLGRVVNQQLGFFDLYDNQINALLGI
jgi:hypothetical protein